METSLGHTVSGKPVYLLREFKEWELMHGSFTPRDHADAALIAPRISRIAGTA